METKCCSYCKKEYPATLEYFSPQVRGKYGLQAKCKKCCREYAAKHRKENPEKIKEIRRRFRNNHQAEISEYRKEYYKENAEREKATNKRWIENNRARKDKINDKWRRNNPQKLKENWQRRRLRLWEAEGYFEPADLEEMFLKQEGSCLYCSVPISLHDCHLDHFIPLSKGGTNWRWNLALACRWCNQTKNDKDPFEWEGRNNRLPIFWTERLL